MKIGDGLFCKASQSGIEFHFPAALALRMKHGPFPHWGAEHFLEAKCLRTKLCVVILECPAPAFFVFDRNQTAVCVAFHDVAFAGESQPMGPHRQRAKERDATCHLVSRKVGMLMRKTAQHGMLVLAPPAFVGFERRATRAVKEVVE
jgi:hypothetical protein